jgi:hypothetical protein
MEGSQDGGNGIQPEVELQAVEDQQEAFVPSTGLTTEGLLRT